MRIHVQNIAARAAPRVTAAEWREAVARAGFAADAEVTFADDAADFAAGVAEAEILVMPNAAVRACFPADAPHLKVVFVTSAGVDGLAPFDWLPSRAVLVNNRGAHSVKAGEFAIMALLMLANQMPAHATAQRAGRWEPSHGSVLAGRRVAVVGAGSLGAATGRHARLFGMHATGIRRTAAPHPDFDAVVAAGDLDAILAESEFVVLACPLTEATRGLLDRRRMRLLPRGAGIVNIGRGALLDQDAACDLLDDGHLSGAVLDVFVPEPVPPGHRLWTTRNLVMTPHVSADDPLTYIPRSLDILLDNLRAFAAGRPMPNLVDLGHGY